MTGPDEHEEGIGTDPFAAAPGRSKEQRQAAKKAAKAVKKQAKAARQAAKQAKKAAKAEVAAAAKAARALAKAEARAAEADATSRKSAKADSKAAKAGARAAKKAMRDALDPAAVADRPASPAAVAASAALEEAARLMRQGEPEASADSAPPVTASAIASSSGPEVALEFEPDATAGTDAWDPEAEPAGAGEDEPEAATEPEFEPQPAEPEPAPEFAPEPEPEPAFEPDAAPEPAPEFAPALESTFEPAELESAPESAPEPEPAIEAAEPEPEPELAFELAPAPGDEPAAEREEHEAPSEEREAPSEEREAPSEEHEAPSEEHESPSEEHESPIEFEAEGELPAEDSAEADRAFELEGHARLGDAPSPAGAEPQLEAEPAPDAAIEFEPAPPTWHAGSAGGPIAAAIDVGSTSVHLLVGTVDGHRVVPLLDESEFLGLGDRAAADGYLGDASRAALLAALERYVGAARNLGAGTITIIGTEPMRRAADAPTVIRDVEARLGLPVHVLDHGEEGLLTLVGATGGSPVNGELLLVDIGGGSTEFVSVDQRGRARAAGLQLGAARLTREFVRSDPPSLAEIEALRREVARLVVDAPPASPVEIVAVGGTASNLLRLLPATAVDRSLTRRRIAVALAMLTVERSREAAVRHLIRPERARILPAGAIIVDAILERYRSDRLRVSEEGLREGVVLASVREGAAWRDRLGRTATGWAEAASEG